jgi:hypothetical protein
LIYLKTSVCVNVAKLVVSEIGKDYTHMAINELQKTLMSIHSIPHLRIAGAMNLPELSALELRRLIGTRQISPVELMEACIAQIEKYNPAINAIAATDFDRARQTAKKPKQPSCAANRWVCYMACRWVSKICRTPQVF